MTREARAVVHTGGKERGAERNSGGRAAGRRGVGRPGGSAIVMEVVVRGWGGVERCVRG